MATITPNTTYPNGATLPVADHNANIYAPVSGRGVMSEPNGGLQVANLDAAFTIRADHVAPGEAVRAWSDGVTVPMDVYSNGFGLLDNDSDNNYVAVGGLCQRVEVPFDVSHLVWDWSFFIAAFRPVVTNQDGSTYWKLELRPFVDGVPQNAYLRQTPISARVVSGSSTSVNAGITNNESICANHYHFTYVDRNVSRGYHEVAIRLYMQRPVDSETLDAPIIGVNGALYSPAYKTYAGEDEDEVEESETVTWVSSTLHTRVSFGTRSVRCVMFK